MRIQGQVFGEDRYTRRSSGDVVHLTDGSLVIPADGNPRVTVEVHGRECDAVLFRNCLVPAEVDLPPVHTWGGGGRTGSGDERAWRRGTWTLAQLLTPPAQHPWHGTGLGAPPAGFEAYAALESTDHRLKFRAGITVDLQVVS